MADSTDQAIPANVADAPSGPGVTRSDLFRKAGITALASAAVPGVIEATAAPAFAQGFMHLNAQIRGLKPTAVLKSNAQRRFAHPASLADAATAAISYFAIVAKYLDEPNGDTLTFQDLADVDYPFVPLGLGSYPSNGYATIGIDADHTRIYKLPNADDLTGVDEYGATHGREHKGNSPSPTATPRPSTIWVIVVVS